MKGSNTLRFITFFVVGLFLGGFIGEVLGVVTAHLGELFNVGKENTLHYFFTQFLSLNWGFGFPPESDFLLDLFVIKIRLGFAIKLNFGCLPGIGLAAYLEKWSR
jgi:hypothetical protein